MFRFQLSVLILISGKIKNTSGLLNVQHIPARYFGESIMDILSNGDLTLKVRLHPFNEKQVNYRIDGTVVTLEAEGGDVQESVTVVERPSQIRGRRSLQSSTTTSYSKSVRTYQLPDEVDLSSIQIKFERGYFVLTAIVTE